MEPADRTQSDVAEAKTSRISDKVSKLRQQMQDLKAMEQRLRESPDGQVSLTDPDARSRAVEGNDFRIENIAQLSNAARFPFDWLRASPLNLRS